MSEKCGASRVPTRDCTLLCYLKRPSSSLIRFSSHLPLIRMDVFGVLVVWTLTRKCKARMELIVITTSASASSTKRHKNVDIEVSFYFIENAHCSLRYFQCTPPLSSSS